MSKPPRPGLDALPFASKKTTPAPAPEPVEPAAPAGDSARAKDDRVTIILRVSAEDRKALKGISVERDTTIQQMLHEAVQDIIRRSR